MPIISVDGVSLYYEEKGAGEPVVFSHGIPTDYRAWENQMDDFSKKYRAITYSRRYAFPNKREGDLLDSTIENNASDLKGLIDVLGIAPVSLIGHSYGGFIAAYLAAKYPGYIRSLVLVEPAITTILIEDENSTSQMLSLLLNHPSVALAARRFQSKSLKPAIAALDAGQLEVAAELNVEGIQGIQGAFLALPEPAKKMMIDNAQTIGELRTKLPPFKDQLGKITCRTLIINGENSPAWSHRIGDILAKSLKSVEAKRIRGARHFPHMEKPRDFNETVLAFIARGEATATTPRDGTKQFISQPQ